MPEQYQYYEEEYYQYIEGLVQEKLRLWQLMKEEYKREQEDKKKYPLFYLKEGIV